MIDKMSQTQLVHVFVCSLKVDYVFWLSLLGHHQVIRLYRGNYTIYDTIYEIKSLLFNEILFFVCKILL